jgi:hypothetical protein
VNWGTLTRKEEVTHGLTGYYWQYRHWFWIAVVALAAVVLITSSDERSPVFYVSLGVAVVIVLLAAVYLFVRFIKWAARG